ncbi:hypothetical protein KAJ83_04400 [Marivibrio halodurans]|uniref:Uncharacterized protein n=1 Tax=Marivibrio halodurans TaxID=2039722 RepID=A0A8J7SH84_9PROT|nr:hypothetical protein [Marivibrio halodurans]MBP5856238.1 hypothetical protein [Marivibrio halodurans]
MQAINKVREGLGDGRVREVWHLPTEEAYLETLLRDIFENHWQGIVFGPIIEGGAFEFRCPGPPKSVTLFDGYLTVHFGGTHFHLCIGDNMGAPAHPTPEDLRRRRRTARAEIFRNLDREGCATIWGLRLFNGADEQLITIFFPNPYLTDADGLAETPDRSRLTTWEAIGRSYLGRELDDADRTGKGFKG